MRCTKVVLPEPAMPIVTMTTGLFVLDELPEATCAVSAMSVIFEAIL